MPKNIKLLLTESVDNLGIVGDVVNVRTGYARNYLMPRGFATTPSEQLVQSLAAKRADAERHLASQRAERQETIKKLDKFELNIERSCNDQGVLYAAVTQQDIAAALLPHGFGVKPREVRLHHAIKRLDHYDVHIKFAADLEAVIRLNVTADRKLEAEEKKDEMEFDDEGELIVAGRKPKFHKPRKSRSEIAMEAQAEAKPEVKIEWRSEKKRGESDAKAESAPAADKAGEKGAKGKGAKAEGKKK